MPPGQACGDLAVNGASLLVVDATVALSVELVQVDLAVVTGGDRERLDGQRNPLS
jgi:hypothetical protein